MTQAKKSKSVLKLRLKLEPDKNIQKIKTFISRINGVISVEVID